MLSFRHPRSTLAFAVGVLFILLLGASQHPAVPVPRKYKLWQPPPPNPFYAPWISTDAKMELAEERYQKILEGRKGMIQRYGPTAKDVESFPRVGKLYTLYDFFIPDPHYCAHSLERVGAMGDGGKWVCGLERIAEKPDCVVYSMGVNGESSFEAAVLERTSGCKIWGYDYSVASFGPEITLNPNFAPRTSFKPFRIGSVDSGVQFPITHTLPTLMQMNNHTWIDILKVDIERAEFETLTHLMKSFKGQILPFGQMQVEIHAWDIGFKAFLEWFELLESAGLRPFWIEPNLVHLTYGRTGLPDVAEYAFVNMHGNHELITDTPSPP